VLITACTSTRHEVTTPLTAIARAVPALSHGEPASVAASDTTPCPPRELCTTQYTNVAETSVGVRPGQRVTLWMSDSRDESNMKSLSLRTLIADCPTTSFELDRETLAAFPGCRLLQIAARDPAAEVLLERRTTHAVNTPLLGSTAILAALVGSVYCARACDPPASTIAAGTGIVVVTSAAVAAIAFVVVLTKAGQRDPPGARGY
jgi:hypothetical protein